MNQRSFQGLTKFLGFAKSNRASLLTQRRNRQLLVEGLERRVVFDATYFALSNGTFTQNWSNVGLITSNDDWSGVPNIIGYLGDSNAGQPTAVDPRTLTADTPAVVADVIANQTAPNTNGSGGVAEFQLTDAVVALQGSGTADAPYLQFHLDTTGRTAVRLQANLRDVDGSGDNAAQAINVQYRIGTTGAWANVTGGYFADVSTGPSLATAVTALDVTLPGDADNLGQVQVRIMTTNAAGNDEWIGIDDIVISSSSLAADTTPPTVLFENNDVDDTVVANETLSYTLTFSEDILNGSLTAADFANAGTSAFTVGTITELTVPGVFTVLITPATPGTLQLQIIGTVEDIAGNDLVVPVQDVVVNVTGDTNPPTVVSINDSDLDNLVPVSVPIIYTLTFSEDIDATSVASSNFSNSGTASISIGAIAETSPGVFTVEVTPTSGGSLVLQIVGVVKDVVGNDLLVPVLDTDTITVDAIPPLPAQLIPVDGSAKFLPDSNLMLIFNEPIVKGTGSITIHNQSDNTVIATIDVATLQVIVAGNTVVINPTADLPVSTGLYVNIPSTAFADVSGQVYSGISDSTSWDFTTTGLSSVIAEQDFNLLTAQTTTNNTLSSGGVLNNPGSLNTGAGLDYQTFWFDTRETGGGPVLGAPDTADFVGVNSFNGNFAPNVSPVGVTVSATEKNFQLNDADGRLDLVFQPISVAGFSNRILTFNYWISATDFEVGDEFIASISDGVLTQDFVVLDSTTLDSRESADNGTPNWQTALLDIDNLITGSGFGTNLTLTIRVSNTDDAGADNVFVDNILVRGTSDVLAPDIEVRGNVITITSGDTTPSISDATSFGALVQNSASSTATFTIANTGNAVLNLTGSPLVSISGSSDFTVTAQPSSPIAAGLGTTTFVVTFTPATLGLQTATISIVSDDPDESPFTFDISGTVAAPPPTIFINEVDANSPGADVAEFIELYDGGVGNTSLSNLVVVFYNGGGDISYGAFDLDGFSTDNNGYFLLGNVGVSGASVTFGNNFLQNGADAVAIYFGDATSFPSSTPLRLENLIDAVVYDTANNANDAGLLTLITAGGQVNEIGTANAEVNSIARVPNGGTLRDSSNFVAQPPTPGASNVSEIVLPTITATPLTKVYDNLAFSVLATADDGPGGFAADTNSANFTYTYYAGPGLTGGVIPAPENVGSYSVDVSYSGSANYSPVASTAFDFSITPFDLTGSITVADKVFDGNTSATILTRTLATVFAGDTVSYVDGTATFQTSAVGTDIVVTATGLSLSGPDAGNYTVNTTATTTANITAPASVVNRRVFYNGGAGGATGFDANTDFFSTGGNPPVSAIDDKVALLPGQNSSFANYTNVIFGLNGIIVDIANPGGTITAADFAFEKGAAGAQTGFVAFTPTELSTTILPVVTQFVGGGINGSTRAKITFNNNSLRNTWVKVTVLANANTGLTTDDVFYFGNAVGEVNGSVTSSRYTINPTDTGLVRANQDAFTPEVNNIYDFDKSGTVTPTDTGIVRANQSGFGILRVIRGVATRGVSSLQAPAILSKSSPVSSAESLPVFGSLGNATIFQTVVTLPAAGSTDAAVKELFAQPTTSQTESSQAVGSIDDFFAQLGSSV